MGGVNHCPPRRTQRDDRDGKDPEILTLDMNNKVIQQARHAFDEIRGVGVQLGNDHSKVTVLTLQLVDLVDELPRRAHRPEDTGLLAPNVPVEMSNAAGAALSKALANEVPKK